MIGPERLWSFAFVDDVADAHVAALTHPRPARDYVVGGVNAPQQAIYEFLRKAARPPASPPAARTRVGRSPRRARAWRPIPRLVHRAPLLTRGWSEIFRPRLVARQSRALPQADSEACEITAHCTDGLARTLSRQTRGV